MKKRGWGFDVRDIDRSVRPEDDFYQYANGGWLKRNKLPATEPRWGTFTILRYKTELQLYAILKSLKGGRAGAPARMIRDFFKSGMDMRQRNTLGITPLLPFKKKIDALSDARDFPSLLAHLHRPGFDIPFGISLDQDAKQSERYVLYLHQEGLGMPDCDYYLKDDPESVRVRKAYVPYVEGLLRLAGDQDAKRSAETVLRIETALAKAWMNKVDRRQIEKTYHKKTKRELAALTPSFNWNRYFADFGTKPPAYVIVMQPNFFRALDRMFKTVSLSDWKTYLWFHVLNDAGGSLGSAFVKHRFSFYGTVLSGVAVMKPLWRRTLGAVNGSLVELFGQLYIKKHFPESAKRKADALVSDLRAVYEERIRALDWMSTTTKRKAIAKLRAMNEKIGYPSRWKSYRGLVVKPNDYAGNLLRSAVYEHRRALRKLARPVDRKEWYCPPQIVNAFYGPTMNDMLFPAAILQAPFFDPNADDAVNYGAIGSVIGHEMTHGFDDEGAKFDSKGNLKLWWTPGDKKRFEAKGRVLVRQFDEYEVADKVKVNGKLTLGENIADFGGISIALDAYRKRLLKTGRKTLSGFTPEQRFFLSFAKFECELIRPEYEKMLALNDTHSPGPFRINGPLSNMPEFYEAFDVRKTNKLYREPKDRAKIW